MKKFHGLCIAALLLPAAGAATAKDIAEIDKNFRPATVEKLAVNYFNALKKPFEITGFPWRKEGGELYRIPKDLTEKDVNAGVLSLARHTSGGAVRFRTNSPYLTIRAVYRAFSDMNHMPRSGSAGFDLYRREQDGGELYLTTVQPGPENRTKPLERRLLNTDGKMHTYTLYLPLYSGVQALEIGVKPGVKILPPEPQKLRKPILFYGSSITQGGCASRPANNYTTMLCRALDAPQINLGFAGSAKGKPALAEAIAKLDLAAFVFDYDYNAPTAAHLAKTHEPFFKIIRKAHPDLPVIILSRCSHITAERRDVIKKTYDNAVKAGDKKVWFIDGGELFGEPGQNFCTVDHCHPNDLGFYMMYKRALPVLKEALGLK